MNVHFPGFEKVWAFWVIFGGMIVTLASLLAFFRIKRWI
jgi:Mg2+ and Co2+ transporter CorA